MATAHASKLRDPVRKSGGSANSAHRAPRTELREPPVLGRPGSARCSTRQFPGGVRLGLRFPTLPTLARRSQKQHSSRNEEGVEK